MWINALDALKEARQTCPDEPVTVIQVGEMFDWFSDAGRNEYESCADQWTELFRFTPGRSFVIDVPFTNAASYFVADAEDFDSAIEQIHDGDAVDLGDTYHGELEFESATEREL